MRVTVFGGTHTKPGETGYEEALKLGKLLGQRGDTVLTGGYIGTMEAVSRGAAEAGAHVIGVTCDEIERYRPGGANRWVKEEQRHAQLIERINGLIDGCDAAIALPGGVGTLAEVMVAWNRMLIGAISPRPLILIGAGWKKVIDAFISGQDGYIAERDFHWVQFAPGVAEAVEMLPPAGRPV